MALSPQKVNPQLYPMNGQLAIIVAATCLSLAATACGLLLADQEQTGDPLEYAEFQTPVAEAQAIGIMPYWLGERFKAGSLVFQIAGASRLIDRGTGKGLEIEYSTELGRGSVGLNLEMYPKAAGGARAALQAAKGAAGATPRGSKVGHWDAEFVTLPLGNRPVNQLWLFVDVGEMIVIGNAPSVESGIPGQDPNPLIEANNLIWAMEQLRPYPE